MESHPVQTTAPAPDPIRVAWNRRHGRLVQVRLCIHAVGVWQTTTGLPLPFSTRPWTLCPRNLTRLIYSTRAKKFRPGTAPVICPPSGNSYGYLCDVVGDAVASRLVVLSRVCNCNLNVSRYILIYILTYNASCHYILHS